MSDPPASPLLLSSDPRRSRFRSATGSARAEHLATMAAAVVCREVLGPVLQPVSEALENPLTSD